MKTGLALFALLALGALIGVSVWATGQVSIGPVITDLLQRPGSGANAWLIATLCDAYFGFLWFWLWVAYKEGSWASRLIWLLLILLLGNMAMASYVLIQLWKLPPDPRAADLLLRRA